MSTINRIAAAEAVNPTTTAGGTVQTQQHIVYQGTADGWRLWSGAATDTTSAGVRLTGTSEARGRVLSQTGDVAQTEVYYSITGQDGSRLSMYFTGPVNRTTGAIESTGKVIEATGAWAHMLGESATRNGTQYNPAGPFVPGQTYFEGVITIGAGAAAAAPQKTTDLGRDLMQTPRPASTASVVSASLQLVAPKARLG